VLDQRMHAVVHPGMDGLRERTLSIHQMYQMVIATVHTLLTFCRKI